MAKDNRHVNVVFGVAVGLLAGLMVAYFAFNRDRAQIVQPATTTTLPPGHPQLPENHPPLDYAKELLTLEQLSRSDPRNAEYKTRIGNIYYDLGQYQNAVAAYQQSLTLRPQEPSVETDLATSLH